MLFRSTSLPGKSQRLEVGFGLFRIIFTLPKLKQKELALNSTETLQLKSNCMHMSLHTSFYGARPCVHIDFVHDGSIRFDRTSARAVLCAVLWAIT